jgi:hypothetical protein
MAIPNTPTIGGCGKVSLYVLMPQTLILDSAQRPIRELKQAILNGVTTWRHGPFSDDVSLVIVEVR